MLLRSVTKHVNDQNWFAVILDLAIVVIGVFIGIEVSNWNAERAGEEKAEILVDRLHSDLGYDNEVTTSMLNYQAVVRSYAITAIDGLNGKETVSDEQLVIAAYQASQISEPWSYRAAYDELLSGGKFDLIKSDELKSLILGYYSDSWAEQAEMNARAPYREYIRSVIPFLIQDTIRSECGDTEVTVAQTFGFALPPSCDLLLPDELFSETAAYLRSQPDMLFKLQYQIAVYESQVTSLIHFGKESEKLMAAIREYQQ
jgi:hypothetical protein